MRSASVTQLHRVRIYPPPFFRDAFTGLWNRIATHQTFLRIPFPPDKEPTPEEIQYAIEMIYGSWSPHSPHPMKETTVILRQPHHLIVTNHVAGQIGTFYAVQDHSATHRYFMAFTFSVGRMTESITGMFVYFDEKGRGIVEQSAICDRVLLTYDLRNGRIRAPQTFFYHQTLIFLQRHRDTRRLILYLHYVNYDQDIITDHTLYYTDYTLSYAFSSPHLYPTEGRFLCFQMDRPLDHWMILDMGSLHIDPSDEERYLEFDTHFTPFSAFSEWKVTALDLPEQPYDDGYPTHCIQCNEVTVGGIYQYKEGQSIVKMGLGGSYCMTCRIRYSESKKEWYCAAIDPDGNLCHAPLLPSFPCSHPHHPTADEEIVVLQECLSLKYPYRKKIQMQWIRRDPKAEEESKS